MELTYDELDFLLRCSAKLAIELVQAGVEPGTAQEAAAEVLTKSLGLFPKRPTAPGDMPEVFRRFIASLGGD